MKIFRITLAVLALGCLASWLWLRKPYSPTQDIPAVTLTAFTVHAPSPAAGHALAEAARGWEGVTAATYNPTSDLLALTHWISVHENDLQRGLQVLASRRIERKVFPELTGAKCPVPQEMLAALPSWFLGSGLVAGIGFFLLLFSRRSGERTLAPFAE